MALATIDDVIAALRSTDLGYADSIVDSTMVLGDQVFIFDSNNNMRVAAISDVVGDPSHTLAGNTTFSGTITATGAVTTDVLQSAEHGAGAIGTGAIGAPDTYRRTENGVIITTIKIDITGLACLGTQAKDAVGLETGTPAAYIGKYVTATYGIVYRIEMSCVELPGEGTATITVDIDLGADPDATIAEGDGDAIDDIVINTASLVAGETAVTDVPALTPNDYIYLIEGGTDAATGVYDAGQYIIRFYGHPLLV